MKSDGRVKTALALCDRCIRAIRSKGEKIYIGELESNARFNACMWCDAPDDELFMVAVDPLTLANDDPYADFESQEVR